MPLIKRYANRKLYDVDAKQYVTLDDLASFIRKGEDIRVVDHVTGDDLTSITLLQVVFEEQKKIGVLLPGVFLTRLIRSGGETVNSLRSRLSGRDPMKLVDDEIRLRLDALVETGKMNEEERSRMQDLLLRKPARADVIRIPVRHDEAGEERMNSAEEEAVEPDEIVALMRQVNFLEEELAALKAAQKEETD